MPELATVSSDPFHIFDRTAAMALPRPTLSRVYAEFCLLKFGRPNENKDGFLAEDVSDDDVERLIGTPIYLDDHAAGHPLKDERATRRAPFYAGSVVRSEKRADGIYCVGAFQREILEDRGIDPARLEHYYSVSMEATFDRTKAKYRVGGRLIPYREAIGEGVASPVGVPDDRARYDVRFIVPIDFHGIAALVRGRNADRGANFLRVAAGRDAGGHRHIEVNEDVGDSW